ncbi:hypothetical protein WJX77_004704 [Trebouxia sp. C0004]
MAHRGWVQRVADQLSAVRSHAVPEAEEPAAWQSIAQELLAHTNQPELLSEQRPLFEEFLSKFPSAALHWKAYAELAMAVNSPEVRSIFSRSLLNCPSVELWSTYLAFIKRVNQSKGDAGMLETRKAYEYALDRIGLDLHSAGLWREYINYMQLPRPNTPAYRALWASGAAPGQEDSQRIMTLRQAYQRAIQIPCTALDQVWRAYEVFEQQGSSRALSRRVLEQQRPRYQAARTALGPRTRLQEALNPVALAFTPGAGGFEQQQQLADWKAYLAWECSNPQKLAGPELTLRVNLAYDQALMSLRLYPDVWLEHADWHMQGETSSPHLALQTLKKARQVLPSCLLLHFAAADLQEAGGDIDASRQVYQELLPSLVPDEPHATPPPQMSAESTTCAWVQCLRFVRRAQSLKDARQTFLKASKVPDIGWQVFEASAMMEWHHDNSNVKVPKNIWELGAKRFMAEPGFVLAYIRFQLGLGDTANSRATFERALTVTPVEHSQPLWDGYLRFESQHGSPEAVAKVEQRRREALSAFSGSDHLHCLLIKHREGDLWPVQPAERDHFKRVLGLLPPIPEPVTKRPLQAGGPNQGPNNGQLPQSVASPMLDTWSPAQAQHPSPLHGAPGPLPLAPGPPPAAPGPHHDGPGPGPLPQAPTAAAVARRPPQPLTQFPVELGNFINKLPPARALEGGHPNVDQVIDILMTADLSGDGRMGLEGMAGHAGPSPAGWGQNLSPAQQHQGPPHHQAGLSMQPDAFDPNAQQHMQAPDNGLKRKQPDNGFGPSNEAHQANGLSLSPTARNAPPAHDVFRMRRKQRTKMADG